MKIKKLSIINMKKRVVRLNESQLKKIVAESVRKVLKESIDVNQFKEALQQNFYETIKSLYTEAAEDWKEDAIKYDIEDRLNDYVDDRAYETANNLAEESIQRLQGDNWNFPSNNFRPLGFVMDREYGIHTFDELLAKENPAEIYTDWFWSAFGTFGVKYNFQNALSDFMGEYIEDDED